MKRKSILFLVILTLVISIFALGCGGQGDTETVIKIGKPPYSSDWPCCFITKYVAEDLGYKTQFVEGDIGFMYTGLAEGDVDMYPSCWIVNLHVPYKEKYGDKIEYPGIIYDGAISGIAVPAYVNINSLAELKGNGKMFDNKIIGIEPSAGLMLSTEKAMQEYGLDKEYQLVQGSTTGMLAALDKATHNEKPILFLPWRPHTMFQQFDIKMLEDPKGVFVPDDIYFGINPNFKDKAPDLYKFTQNFKIGIGEIENIMKESNEKEANTAELARKWVNDNQEQIKAWLNQ